MTYTPREGDHVRVVLEGKVDRCGNNAEEFDLGNNIIMPSRAHVKSVEKIDPPEDWCVDDVVVAANGAVYRREPDNMWETFTSGPVRDEIPRRPLTLLVRNGKPVAS